MTIRSWNAPEIEARIRAAAMRGVVTWIGLIEQRWVDLITKEEKSGRVYRRRGVAHQASAPGEPPASDTGTLLNSRRIDLIPERIAARMTITAKHGSYLENGTRRMEPRPSVGRALHETLEDGQAALGHEVMGELR